MSVDPGLSGTGIAVWQARSYLEWKKLEPPLSVGVVTIPVSKGDFVLRTGLYCESLEGRIKLWNPNVVYCEYPIFFNDAGGQMGMETGDIPKLIFLVGSMAETCRRMGVRFVPVTVREWKGQVSKAMMEKRIIKKLGVDVCERLDIKSHAWDAVGIGLKMKEVHK